MTLNTLFTLVNMGAAAWLVVSAISVLHHKNQHRDPRPLVMPIFAGIAFFFLSFTWLSQAFDQEHPAMIMLGWNMVHFGMIIGLLLFVRSYSDSRHRTENEQTN